MELKKDSNAVSIDMLLIVHSEKLRAAQGAHPERQTDPGALPQRRGGNEPRPGPPGPRHLSLLAPEPARPGAPHAPWNEVRETDSLPAAACSSARWPWRPMATRSPVLVPG